MDRKEAIEVIKKNYPHVGISGSEFETALRELVPELSESEDERIRKELVNLVKNYGPVNAEPEKYNLMLAWLEKQQPAEWSEEDDAKWYGVIETEEYMLRVVRGEQRFDVGNKEIERQCEEELDWLKSLRPQPKQEWGEEDEKYRNELIAFVEEIKKQPLKRLEDWNGYINWLKSLHPQKHWKPSEEQMEALETIINSTHNPNHDICILRELYNDLKKL